MKCNTAICLCVLQGVPDTNSKTILITFWDHRNLHYHTLHTYIHVYIHMYMHAYIHTSSYSIGRSVRQYKNQNSQVIRQ